MPQCPHCQTEHELGQRYCQVCGSFLLHPETGDTFCPQCGIRVSRRQEFCHECDAPLKGEAAAALAPEEQPEPAGPAAPTPPTAPAKGLQSWVVGLLVAAGVIILLLLILVFTRTEKPAPLTPPPPPKAEAPAPPAAPPAPPAAAPEVQPPSLKEQLQTTLAKMREARLKKDIILLMDCYSRTFPDLDEKRREALKAWENYDYTNMVFTIDEVQPLDADNANATVTWYVDLKNRRTGELISSTQTFKVRFAKELGQWRIRTLEEAE
ncbi:MAG: zinc ribbon domain-containing protein [Deltaproteobacteria bacterium]|nr:zinc ribbon domain-containing protein [Deltaproteobacteria bacterium]MBI4795048.1 zinc ribbon domain-containing protein [Deltaproteobacteria bacterium]